MREKFRGWVENIEAFLLEVVVKKTIWELPTLVGAILCLLSKISRHGSGSGVSFIKGGVLCPACSAENGLAE